MELVDKLRSVGISYEVQIAILLLVITWQLYSEIKIFNTFITSTVAACAHFFESVVRVTRDYHSGRYYKPWKPSHATILVSTKQEIAELSEASSLSQRAVYADMFGFKHTMNNFAHNTSEFQVLRTRLFGRLLHVSAPANLEAMYPHLTARLDDQLRRELSASDAAEGGRSVPLAQTIRRLASTLMGLMFFGEQLSADETFSQALLQYPRDMVKCMGAFQVTPSFLSTVVHAILTKRGQAMHHIQGRLFQCMGPGQEDWDEPEETKRLTIMHNMAAMTENSNYWTPQILSQCLLGIWFAASHQPWMNLHFILVELCQRPEWQERLRLEMEEHAPLDYRRIEQLPLLDGFIKETVRMRPLDTQAIRRKALAPYTFKRSSVHVPLGATVCVSAYDLMHDGNAYAEPDTFDPTRYAAAAQAQAQAQASAAAHDGAGGSSKFADVSESFPLWGFGSRACPGRLHASLVLKMIMTTLLSRYDLALEDPGARTRWHWETFTMPFGSTRMVLRERPKSAC